MAELNDVLVCRDLNGIHCASIKAGDDLNLSGSAFLIEVKQMHETTTVGHNTEAIVAVFTSADAAAHAVRSLDQVGLEFAEISAESPPSDDQLAASLRELFYSKTNAVGSTDVVDGIAKGAAIGAATGLLFIAVPIIGLMAPIGGFLGGALIGGMAGIDEAAREAKLPDLDDYRQLLDAGKGLVVIPGDEAFRTRLQKELKMLGAESVHQHPPIAQSLRHPDTQAPKTDQAPATG